MPSGYMGKLLFVDLSTGSLHEEIPDEGLYRDYIGGYGVGARVIYNRQKAGVDPMGPENTLGFMTGPLTGSPASFGCRYTVVGKSPLTGGWGDANCGGDFGPHLKFAGYDGVFITGIAEKPVYLFIDNGRAEIRDASHMWGKSTFETNDIVLTEHGKAARVVSIGQAGELKSLVANIMNKGGDAAGRSGMGGLMGSKKLKAVVVKGEMKVPVADMERAMKRRKEHIAEMQKTFIADMHHYGTTSHAEESAHSGDSPVKNWGGVGIVEMPDASGIRMGYIDTKVVSRTGCWRCPAACKGGLVEGTGLYKYPRGSHRPEYETLAAFGCNCLINDFDAIAMANHICNSYGIDTISAGSIIAFAMECYENGIITKSDTDGIELTWGNHHAMIAMLEKIVKREGIGDILADGVMRAADRFGKPAEKFAVHIDGQEPGMHDPKMDFPAFAGKPVAAAYQIDATPGRHTAPFGWTKILAHVVNASGLCLHGTILVADPNWYMAEFLSSVIGWERTKEDLLLHDERICTMRHVFNLREGINPLQRKVPPRMIGRPPQKKGPLAGKRADFVPQVYWCMGKLDWDRLTAVPSKKRLLELGMDDIAQDFYPQ
ncbi:MAG: aldehyde ferredoxin oxidoreductase family protein [Dehalococcoidia bacterium]